MRVYDGWHAERAPTPNRVDFEKLYGSPGAADDFSRTIGGVSFPYRPEFGDHLVHDERYGTLYDTHRAQGQKMVDTAIVADALALLMTDFADLVIIVSDDDDYIPAMVTGDALDHTLYLLRRHGRSIENVFNGSTFARPKILERSMSVAQLSEDLERFKDPATDITTRAVTSGIEVKMVRNGEQRTYFYNGSTGQIDRRDIKRRSYVSVRSLLASDDFADLSGFADTQRRILSQRQDIYLEPVGLISSGTSPDRVQLDMNTFMHITKPSAKERLQCVLIDGPAGVGKTVLIERLVRARAQPPTDVPVLHVTSRGQRLTNLRDALAGTTTSLRAKFVPDKIPVLVRHGLIQVALDGFDEFVDPSGYQDASGCVERFYSGLRQCRSANPCGS